MKICLTIHALSAGGMERVMAQLVSFFSQKESLEVHLVLYGIKRDIFYTIPDKVIIHKPDFKFSNSQRTWHTAKTLFFLRRTIKKINPDTVLSFGEVWNNLVLLALWGLTFPVYISDRSQPGKDLGRFHNYLRNFLYPKANGFIAQTKIAKQITESAGRNSNICVIGNPIRTKLKVQSLQKENIVLSVGRLIRTKNIDQLIQIFSNINMPGWKLVIVGGDAKKQELMTELQSLVKSLNMSGKIILTGTQSNVDSYYNKSRIFAFTSNSEGFPNVIGEAMAAGLPVISFDCVAGPSEMIQDGENGFLIPIFDYAGFEKKLKSLMEDITLREKLGKKAKQSIRMFSVESIGKQFYSFITKSK